MKISVKGRYALAAMIHMASFVNGSEYMTVISISEKLGVSKIYLEQVFSLLKKDGLLHSVKGAQGGYQITRAPEKISAYEILLAIEFPLFEKTEDTVQNRAPEIEKAMQTAIFGKLDDSVRETLEKITLAGLVTEAEGFRAADELMFYI